MAPYIDSRDFPHSQSIKDTSIASRYWEERFNSAGSQSRLACLPVDYQWPRAETTAVASNGLLKAAMRFCYTHNTSVEDLIYAAWAIVSARQAISSGPVTTVFTIAGRRSTVTLNGDNAYDYHYPLVLSVPEDLDVLSCIRTVGTAAASAASHSYIEYEQIMEIGAGVRPQVKLSVMFSDDNHDTMAPDDDRFPLLFNIYVSEDLKLTMRHNATVPRADIRVLLDRFAITLQRMTENSRANVSSIDVMLPSEMQLLLDYGKAAFKPRSGLVHRLVEEQANLKPDAAAVQFEADPPLTYAVLNRRSNQLACQLRQHSASYIAVHMRVCADFIVAVLAILKSGAAYVILDPDAPVSRKAFILDDLQPGMVLADHSTAGELEKEIQLEVLLSQSFSHDPADLMLDQDPSSVAYVIYTSGSTGHPKSVLLEHQAAFNGLLAFPPVENLRQLLFFNPAFSAAQRSIWATLSVGGCLCLASKENLTVHTAKMIHIMDVNAVDMTPSAAALISPGDVPSLRRMVLGGDMINPAIIRTWEHRVKLFSSYGLSECTQLNWRYRLNTNASSRMIGQPYDTTTSYILHPGSTQLSPLLVPGELCLGGAQLAKGYLNRPDETAKRFIRNAFGKGRLYRTGDLAVRHADGSVEMIGRIDFQVKINGHRVDPGEPRSIIQAVEEVEDSAVVPASLSNRTVLVAAVVSRVDADWDALVGKLRSLLSARLPLYMVPSFWVPMSALPINTNGKTDMMAIREMVERLGESGQLLPERSHQDSAESSLTKNEKIVRSLWSKYLSLAESDISLEDSFISLGGSSLEAIQVVSQLQSVHGLSLQVRDILLGTSLSQVAGSVQRQVATEEKNDTDDPTSSALSRVAPSVEDLGITISEVEDAFFVTPFQEAAIANTLLGGTSYIYSRSYSFEGYSSDNVKVAFETLMQSDGCLRTTFVPDGLTFLQLVRKSASIPWETSNMDVAEYMQQQVSKTMQPGELWWRVAVFPNNILVITAHHALFDFWSNEFLIEDIGLELQGVLRVQRGGFRRFAEYLRQHDEVVMQNFWQQYLDGAVPSSLGSQAAVLESTVTAEAHCDLKGTASQRGVTPGVLLYAAWAVVLGLANSTDDVVMGVTISGRDAPVPGILQMSGPTLMVAPLRIKVDNTSSLDELCKNVQLNLWGVARNAPYGLRKIFKASGQSKALFDTMANFLLKIPTAPGGLRPMPESNLGTVEYTKLELRNDSLNRVTLTSTLEPLYAQALVDTLVAVLKTASDAPFTEIGAFEQVPRVRGKLNGSEADEPDDSQVHIHEIEDQIKNPSDFQLGHSALQKTAASHPGRTAVEDLSGARITYAGLVIKMNQLAGILREKGVMLEQVVPIMLQKSINTVVAMFGILVAGGAFLPLDPETPRERNLGILEDCSTKLVITDTQNAGFFKETSYEVVIIDVVAWDTLPLQRQIVPELNPDSLAYVIYTSGR